MRRSTRATLLQGMAIAISCLSLASPADARHNQRTRAQHHFNRRYATVVSPVIQCVAFARSDTDIALAGNAVDWWQNAAGVYARGTAPEVGSVLNFRANDRMRLGHVAVVTNVIDSRTIQIDQSHWNARGISRDVSVIDVSENNDWSAVRVALSRQNSYGSIYPTYGFIYARPDRTGRIVVAQSDIIAPRLTNPARSSLVDDTEVAEVPATAEKTARTITGLHDDGPDRSLR